MSEIGAKYSKTAAKIALKWNVQRGVCILPKSVHADRMAQNFDLWDFKLIDEEMKQIDALDLGHSEIIGHYDPNILRFIHGSKVSE